jgi:prephenate dehydrogenase
MTSLERVTILGTGLIGTSIGLALRRHGIRVALEDRDASAVETAVRLEAGTVLTDDIPPADLVVVCVPPANVGQVLASGQRRALGRYYTDVASVKKAIIESALRSGCDLSTYVPGHPMSGSERSGPIAARAELFVDRTCTFCPTSSTLPTALDCALACSQLVGAIPCVIDTDAHDRATALMSHTPHLVASALAALFADSDSVTLSLIGRGLLDVTRIAAGNPVLWTEILTLNAYAVADVVDVVATDLAAAAAELRVLSDGIDRSTKKVVDLLVRGNNGIANFVIILNGRLRMSMVKPEVVS